MKKSHKDAATDTSLQYTVKDAAFINEIQTDRANLTGYRGDKEDIGKLYNSASSLPYKKTFGESSYTSTVDFEKMPSATSCQFYPKIIVDGVDVVKMLTDIAVTTGALRDATSVFNLDVIRHWSAERLAYFIINDSKKIISGSGDAVAELTEWLKSKAD